MDLSPLIFVALAVAWAVYLVPQALKHHDEVVRSRSVDRFSHTMRVLARREPVSRTSSRLVVTPGRTPSAPVVTTKESSATAEPAAQPPAGAAAESAPAPKPLPPAVRREAARRAARRRRRVLIALTLGLVAVVALAAFSVVAWPYVAIPGALMVAWLVACRLMVRRERGVSGPLSRIPTVPVAAQAQAAEVAEEADDLSEDTAEVAVVETPLAEPAAGPDPHVPDPAAPGLWNPVPVTLPTYVSKPAAERRSVRTIDLDATGVWTSGRTDADAALVREAEERARHEGEETPERAVGS
ncbi:hypothetical protein [uncultured Nocardioides sp.]|uniref:divisome protein SepX/GlpR n=1 Tax=uncultured Nocardioides sp. TaxID=198441 RepID=UPI002631CBDE|nr:hypothetical protein [uncultured Nocardioides sp.]